MQETRMRRTYYDITARRIICVNQEFSTQRVSIFDCERESPIDTPPVQLTSLLRVASVKVVQFTGRYI